MIGWVCFRVFSLFFFFPSHGSRGEVMVFAVGIGVVFSGQVHKRRRREFGIFIRASFLISLCY